MQKVRIALARIMCADIHSKLDSLGEILKTLPPSPLESMAAPDLSQMPPEAIPAALRRGIDGERLVKTRRKVSVDGWEREEEEEERAAPTTRRQLQRLHLVFRNTLLMCLAAFLHFPQFNLTKEDLNSFYERNGRRNAPSEQTLLYAERNAWREIHDLMHSGLNLKEAMVKVKKTAFSGCVKSLNASSPNRPRAKRKEKARPRKGNGATPSGNPTGNNPKEKELVVTCQGQCGRSHNCPVNAKPKIILLTSAPAVLDGVLRQPVALRGPNQGRERGATRIQRTGMVVDTVHPLRLPLALTDASLDFLMDPTLKQGMIVDTALFLRQPVALTGMGLDFLMSQVRERSMV